MRILPIFIALIVLSLFAVVLSSVSQDLFSGQGTEQTQGLGISRSEYMNDTTSNNATNILNELAILTSTESAVGDIARSSPSGIDSTLPAQDTTTQEGVLQQSGLGVVTKIGVFLFSVPKVVISSTASYFNINPAFVTGAIAIFILMIALILVSSILRNRL